MRTSLILSVRSALLLLSAVILLGPARAGAQELSVLPRGTLEPGERAVVSGEDVRIRSGPSLQHRILGSANSGAGLTVMERGALQAIGDMNSHWYRVRLESDGREGWVYGWFLRKPGRVKTGPLAPHDRATVTGDDVRVRSGPSLQHRILGSVNSGTGTTILERGGEPADIGGARDYWYRVKVDGAGTEGWIFGGFLAKRDVLVVATTTTPSTGSQKPHGPEGSAPGEGSDDRKHSAGDDREPDDAAGKWKAAAPSSFLEFPVDFLETATIDHPRSLGASGDLDNNGRPEILLLSSDGRGRYRLAAYEPRDQEPGFKQVYTGNLSGRGVRGASVLTTSSGEAFLAVEGELYSTLYRHDDRRGGLIRVRTFDSPLLAAGSLDGVGEFIVHLQRNRSLEHDGTVTYTLVASKIELAGGRIRMLESFSYPYRLPVKKLLVFDLDGDGRDEIVCEIGGKDRGGGVVILRLEDQSLARIENTGVVTSQDRPFVHMWGVTAGSDPYLVLYTSNPADGNDLGGEVGFLSTTFDEEGLRLHRFRPVNKLLEEVNNERMVLHYPTDMEQVPFIVLDYRSGGGYSVKKPVDER